LRHVLHQALAKPHSGRPQVRNSRSTRSTSRRRRELLRDFAQCAQDAVGAYVQDRLGKGVPPGVVVSIATAGDLAQWHPHLQLLTSDGGFSPDGTLPEGVGR
jgi:hypothetical protein